MIPAEHATADRAAFTPQEFQAAVLAQRPRTAVFDCDGTLWAPDSGLGFMHWSLGRQMVAPDRRSWIEERYRLYEAGAVDEATICGEMVQMYAGVPEQTLREAAGTYVREHVLPRAFPAMLSLVQALGDQGVELWAVSSTNNWVVEAGVWDGGHSPFCIPPQRILAAEVAVSGGLATETLIAVPTGEAKAAALVAAGLPHPDAVFGNSVHDAAMLSIAGRAYPVNPSPGLTRLARVRGWRIYLPSGE